ncbi:MAG: TRAP transporter substrate-binding protein [bacterium]|jgi:tripartite ATP-independent transporter DctP family solute receptor
MRKVSVFQLALLIGCFLYGCSERNDVKVIKLAHGLEPDHSVHQAMVFFGKRLAEMSEGTFRVDIYPSEQLGSERECIELLQIGSLGMTKVSTSPLEGFVPIYKVLSLPYLFRDEEHRFQVLESEIGERFLTAAEEFGLRGLCFYDAGSRSFYTKNRPILKPEDLQGQKIRTQESATAIAMVLAMGGAPTPISWGELYSALQQGIVDGAENNPPSFQLSKHYEQAKYYSLDEHTAVPDVLLMSKSQWDKYTPEEQEMILAAARESADYQKKLWKESTRQALEEVAQAGVEIHYPDKAPFQEAVQGLYETFADQPDIREMIERIKNVGT